MGRLEGKVAIVTGANSGVGAATAKLFAAEGASLVITARRLEPLQAVADEITAAGGKVVAMKADISVIADDDASVKLALDTYGKLAILVNCAGVLDTDIRPIDCYLDSDWEKVFSVNAKGTMQMTRAALTALKTGASVVNVVSVSALNGGGGAAYTASKGAIVTMTKHAALRYQNAQIRFNAICPGTIVTPMVAGMDPAKINQDMIGAMAQHSNLQAPPCMPEDVANVALFLASDESKCITGQIITTDFGSNL